MLNSTEYRHSVRQYGSDQGADINIGVATNIHITNRANLSSILAQLAAGELDHISAAVTNEFLWPEALPVADNLHVMFNALETTVTAIDGWHSVEAWLQGVWHFLQMTQVRQRFVQICVSSEPKTAQYLVLDMYNLKRGWRVWGNHGTTLIYVIRSMPYIA